MPHLRQTYCGTMAYEIEHIANHEERVWLRKAIESGHYRTPLSPEEKKKLLERLVQTEGLEQFLHRTFLGQKQFSIEGLDVLVPMLDEAIDLAADAGAHEVVIGMAHRGRLNVLAHMIGVPYEEILREFEGERTSEAVAADPERGSGDVKYHHGAEGTRTTEAGEITVTLAANPSHLEAVDPIVEGRTRAEQTDRSSGPGIHDPRVALPILIHGDASFPGQGVVAETLNLEDLAGYTTGGTLHVIANNQIGFTTDPQEGRSTRYSSDLAKGFDIPIIHVNADDAEAAISAVRLALAYRSRFGEDVMVDLVGYRQARPQRAGRARVHAASHGRAHRRTTRPCASSSRRSWSSKASRPRKRSTPRRGRWWTSSSARTSPSRTASARRATKSSTRPPPPRFRPRSSLLSPPNNSTSSTAAHPFRTDFTVHPKLARQLERRIAALDEGADRLGTGGVARVRDVAGRRYPHPADRTGHGAGDVLAPAPRPA